MSRRNDSLMRSLNRLAKWRTHFAGWQLGTRPKGDPEGDAVRDMAEARLLLRAEATALVSLLVEKGVFTSGEWEAMLERAADDLCTVLEQRWPGVRATDDGLSYDKRALAWMKGWKP